MIALLAGWSAWALPPAVEQCLDRLDTGCADRVLDGSAGVRTGDPEWLAALGTTRFYEGRYPEAYDAMKSAVAGGFVDRFDELPLYERTLYATANWVEEARGRFVVRFRPGVDAILLDDAFTAIHGSDEHIATLLGGSPPGVSRVELYPDARSFIAASSLMLEDVETTGVVGLAKWGRLLVTSPRALERGYNWQDTIAHEYIHLVVAHHTADRAPVWLQEAIAKYLDARWRDGQDHFRLTQRQEGLLAEALRDDDLVTFDEMHPSLAKLPTAERASLAYAQLAMLMKYCFERGGPEVLKRTLPAVAQGQDPREALAAAAGAVDFATLEADWRAWIARQPLGGKLLQELPTVLDGGDELATDPVLAQRQDLARYVTIGDLLRTKGLTEAALVEYAKAVPEDGEPASPILANRIAQANLDLKRLDLARKAVEASLEDYPEFALSHKTLGQILLQLGELPRARDELDAAAAIHPFDPEVQGLLLDVLRKLGDTAGVARRERYLQIRARGGDDAVREPIHTREGEYELPSQHAPQGLREKWVGRAAPSITVTGLDGREIRLDDFAGKVVVLDFWATWCGPCRRVMPELDALYEAKKAEGVEVIGITDEDASIVRAFLGRTPVGYPIVLDRARATNQAYDVSALPTLFVLDRRGTVREVVVGGADDGIARARTAIEAALGGSPTP